MAKLDDETAANMYGLTYAMIKSNTELRKLFRTAVAKGYTATLFQAKLKNTKWWSSQSSTLRQYLVQKYSDPGTWKQNRSATAAKINALAVQVGLGNQISKGQYSKLLNAAIYNSKALGWTDDRVKDWLGARAVTHGGAMWGEAGEAFDKLHSTAYLNGISHSTKWYADQSRAIAGGRSTLEAQEASIRTLAAAKYSAFADQIKAGQNVMDLASPYIKSVSSILELPETGIDLKNKYVSDAMTGAKAGASYPLWEFENKLRDDPLWKKTNNARESMMTTARSVLKDFGFSY